jgi:hypothetical protein
LSLGYANRENQASHKNGKPAQFLLLQHDLLSLSTLPEFIGPLRPTYKCHSGYFDFLIWP